MKQSTIVALFRGITVAQVVLVLGLGCLGVSVVGLCLHYMPPSEFRALVLGLVSASTTAGVFGTIALSRRPPTKLAPPDAPPPPPNRRAGHARDRALWAVVLAAGAAAWAQRAGLLGAILLFLVAAPGCGTGATLATVVASAKPVTEVGCWAVRRAADVCDLVLGPEPETGGGEAPAPVDDSDLDAILDERRRLAVPPAP